MTDTGIATELAATFRRLIERHGPMPVSRYMGESNARYYAARDPLGSAGDFTTAPEISQMFGEMVGLWLADLWNRSGRPAAAYVELGPGRGTLARDALRAMNSQGMAPPVHLVEGSEALRKLQADTLSQAQLHNSIETLPGDQPLYIVANEFLDALPIRQLVMTERGWRERMVALEDDRFVFAAGRNSMDDAVPEHHRSHPVGTVIETCPAAAATVEEIARRIDIQGGAALFIDYGYCVPQTGETLQAVRTHKKVDVFHAPGEMDLTALVDFATLGDMAKRAGLAVNAATQGAWLNAIGIGLRAQALAQRAPDRAEEFDRARDRLIGTDQMGDLFKVMALTPRDAPRGAGFG